MIIIHKIFNAFKFYFVNIKLYCKKIYILIYKKKKYNYFNKKKIK